MSTLYAYISTKTTADPYIPPTSSDIRLLSRDVSDAFVALSGGYQMVGELKMFPVQRSVPGHLLCDGREVYKAAYPELFAYLQDSQGTPADPDKFVLPSFVGATDFTPAPAAEVETENSGTVSTPPPLGDYDPANYGDVDSGGRGRFLEP